MGKPFVCLSKEHEIRFYKKERRKTKNNKQKNAALYRGLIVLVAMLSDLNLCYSSNLNYDFSCNLFPTAFLFLITIFKENVHLYSESTQPMITTQACNFSCSSQPVLKISYLLILQQKKYSTLDSDL